MRSHGRRSTLLGILAGAVALTSAVACGLPASAAGSHSAAAHPSVPRAASAGSGYWHTSGSQILDSQGNPVRISGINWYGFETSSEAPNGLWSQDYKAVIDDIRDLGYDTIRLPWSDQVVEDNPVPSVISFYGSGGPINTDLKGLHSLDVMGKIIDYAGQDGLKVILDNHRSEAGNSAEQNGLWYTAQYPESSWINDWTTLAKRYANNPTVVGVDLRNEPHTPSSEPYGTGATWGTGSTTTDWRLAAERAGDAVLAVNPNLLIAVEGIDVYQASGSSTSDSGWWGGNLEGAAQYPVQLSVPNRLVYSAHDYGPDLFQQTWFNSSTTYESLAAVWNKFWGYLAASNTAPVWVGEFGTTNTASDISSSTPGSQGQWFSSLVQYIKSNNLNWTYWALNGEDSFALLDNQYDPSPVSAQKQALLASIQASNSGGGGQGSGAPATPTGLTVTGTTGTSVSLNWSASTGASGYTVYRNGTVIGTPTGTSYTDTALSSGTAYTYTVAANGSGSASAPSSSVTATTSTGGGASSGCTAVFQISSQWQGGFQANVTITNVGASATTGWTVTWQIPSGQQIISVWNAAASQGGQTETATNESYNGAIASAASTSFGIQGSGSATAPVLSCATP
jgi:endoglucanase